MPYDTLESAQARILELEDELSAVRSERDSLSEDNKSKDERIEELRTENQKYFNRLIAQVDTGKPNEDEEPEIPTCEEFAKTLNI